jgi:hypothetical protein
MNGITIVRAPTSQELSQWWSEKEPKVVTIVPEHDVDSTFAETAFSVRSWYQKEERKGPHERAIGFIVDEARFKAVRDSTNLDWLFRCTDVEMMHVYLTVHRPKDLHPDIRAILDYWYVFHIHQQIDLDVLEDETEPIITNGAPRLKPREFYLYDVAEQKVAFWREVRSECSNGNHRMCSHIWRPIGEPSKVRQLNPMAEEDDQEFELL